MIRAALDHDVAGAQQRLLPIQYQVDLAGEHDTVVDGAGPVHQRMRGVRVFVGRGVLGAEGRKGRLGRCAIQRVQVARLGRMHDDAEARAVGGRLEPARP